jgi:ABC-2 type transport system ATP-binding protein
MIKTYNLRKNYASLTAVKDVNITLSKGEILGLVGPNGAGKTTLLKMLSTLIEPTTGSALIMGHDIFKEKLQIRRHIGYLPDFFNLYDDLKLRELLYFFAHTYGVPEEEREERINIALEETDLFMKQNDFIKNLSRGMTQRLGLAALLVHEPAIFLLDEPASGLDPQARITLRTILKKLAAKGKTIIISSHILTELDGFCSHIAIMNKGELLLHEKVDIVQSQIKGRRSLKVTVLNKVEEALKIIKNFSGVSKVSNTNKTFSAEYLGDDELIANINTELVKNGVKVVNIIREKKNFEDLFMQLTKELDLSV